MTDQRLTGMFEWYNNLNDFAFIRGDDGNGYYFKKANFPMNETRKLGTRMTFLARRNPIGHIDWEAYDLQEESSTLSKGKQEFKPKLITKMQHAPIEPLELGQIQRSVIPEKEIKDYQQGDHFIHPDYGKVAVAWVTPGVISLILLERGNKVIEITRKIRSSPEPYPSNKKPLSENDIPVFRQRISSSASTKPQPEILERKKTDQHIDPNQRKSDWNLFVKIVEHYQIKALYHFTDSANIASIKQHGGLYSWWFCQENGISIPKPGGNETSRELDRHKDLRDYVRLSFNQNSPMLKQALHDKRIEKYFVLKISPDLIYRETTKFSNMNATANNAYIGGDVEDFKRIKFEIVTQPTYPVEAKSFYQAEVLVKTHVPIQYILNMPQG